MIDPADHAPVDNVPADHVPYDSVPADMACGQTENREKSGNGQTPET